MHAARLKDFSLKGLLAVHFCSALVSHESLGCHAHVLGFQAEVFAMQ